MTVMIAAAYWPVTPLVCCYSSADRHGPPTLLWPEHIHHTLNLFFSPLSLSLSILFFFFLSTATSKARRARKNIYIYSESKQRRGSDSVEKGCYRFAGRPKCQDFQKKYLVYIERPTAAQRASAAVWSAGPSFAERHLTHSTAFPFPPSLPPNL